MKTHSLFTTIMLMVATIFLVATTASATTSPLVDTLNVQGYMKKSGAGGAVTDGTYNMAIGVFQNGTALWAKQFAVTTSNGLFSQALSGTGTDFSGSATVGVSTGMHANFSAATLNAALLDAGAQGEVMIRVFAISTIDGANPQFDIALGATPTSMVAALAQSVEAGSVTLAGLAGSATATVGGAGSAGRIPLLAVGTGLIDSTMLPAIDSTTLSNGSITGTGSVTYKSAGNGTTTIGDNTGSSSVVVQSGTGGISETVSGATGNINLTAGATSGSIDLTPGTTSGPVSVGSTTSSGNVTLQTGSGNILLNPASGVVRILKGGLNLVNGAGTATISSATSGSWTMTLPNSFGSVNQVLTTDGTTGATSWSPVPLASPAAIGSTLPNTGAFTTLSATGQITSTLATGTAPFAVASTTNVANLNASSLNGATFASPGAIGGTVASAGTFTTVSASTLASTVATGTAPFTVASTTNVANLNASSLNGATFAVPGAIGGTTASAGTFTTMNATTATTIGVANNATGTSNGLLAVMTATGAQKAATTSTSVLGVVVSGAGTSGTAQIATTGTVSCTFDNATNAGDFAAISTTTAGDCTDVGTQPKKSNVLGMVTTTGAAGSQSLLLNSAGGTMPIRAVSVVKITATGNYTPTAGTLFFIAEAVGGGGGGGTTAAATGAASSGGGSGSYAKVLCPISEVNGTAAITIGTGGAAGVAGTGTTMTLVSGALGTSGGGLGVAGAASVNKTGGAGGAIATNTDANCTSMVLTAGQPGGNGQATAAVATAGAGGGGSSPFGNGGSANAGVLLNGGAGSGFGSGGGGGLSGGAAQTGGAGTAGVVVITEFRAF